MKGMWTQETTRFKGRYYSVEGRIEPKPMTKPHPPYGSAVGATSR